MPEQVAITVSDAIELFLESVLRSRSENTARTYQNGMNLFKEYLPAKISIPILPRLSGFQKIRSDGSQPTLRTPLRQQNAFT